jgi:hypothetical protein
LSKRSKIWGLALLPLLREKTIAAERDEDKATLFANLLAAHNVPAAHLTANDALPQLSIPYPAVYEPFKLVNVGEIQEIGEALLKGKHLAPMGSLVRC